jgi:hypothetical protein
MAVQVRFRSGRQRTIPSANAVDQRDPFVYIRCDGTELAVYSVAEITQVTLTDDAGTLVKVIGGEEADERLLILGGTGAPALRLRVQPTRNPAAPTALEFLGVEGESRSILFTSFSPMEWRALLETRCNLLIIGEVDATDAVVLALRASAEKVCDWVPGDPLPALEAGATLVIRDVATLSPARQHQLIVWLDQAASRPQILTTSSVPVWPFVERGVFAASLYYRLSAMVLKLRGSHRKVN